MPAAVYLARLAPLFATWGEPPMALREYLYFDEKRLNSYVEQISGPVTYDKVPTYVAGLSLAGPKAETTQSRFGRPFTPHEKVLKIEEYLGAEKLLHDGRPTNASNDWRAEGEFFIEETRATRAFIPPGESFPGLAVWFTPDIEQERADFYESRHLYLFEDYPRDDLGPRLPPASGYTYFMFLLADNPNFRHVCKEKGPSKLAFLQRPAEFFDTLGAKIGDERHVRTLYRVRVAANHIIHHDQGKGDTFKLVVIAYPIYIALAR